MQIDTNDMAHVSRTRDQKELLEGFFMFGSIIQLPLEHGCVVW